ncbi:MAG: glycosyltransferase family 2 protein [Bacteroidetes bacterium]|nr:glycosyltransferase family 2 protein [Bacteroidota bacterium]
MSNKSLDIILPCFNPDPEWSYVVINSIKRIREDIPEAEIAVYLVNDGSTLGMEKEAIDRLSSAIRDFHYLEYQPNKGKGEALRYGVMQAKNEVCIYTDVDFPYKDESFIGLYTELCRSEDDVVIGIRDNEYYSKIPPARRRISLFLRGAVKLFFGLKISDTQCGLKGFNQRGKKLFLQTRIKRYLFDMEFILLASKSKEIIISSYPVVLRSGIEFSKVNLRVLLAESFNFFRLFLKNLFK